MILSDKTIQKYIESRELEISADIPLLDEQFQSCTVDLRLGENTMVFTPGFSLGIKCEKNITLNPNEFIICHTLEFVRLPDFLVGHVTGKSSIGRDGIAVEFAGLIDPGFPGQIVLEIKELRGAYHVLDVGMMICQIEFELLDQPCERPYGHEGLKSHYLGQTGATGRYVKVRNSD